MMTIWVGWTVLLALVSCVWALRHREVSRFQTQEQPLSPTSFDKPPADAPRISVVIAAKDEEANIDVCVRTLLDQDYPDFELIIVNDRSEDRTAEILAAIEDPTGRLKVLHVTELRDGWYGKTNAMRVGVEAATGEWLCFSDADCRQVSNRTLSVSMCLALEKSIDFLSVLPVLETGTFAERVIQPAASGLMVFWFNPRKVNNPATRTAYANGAFMLMTRKAYETIGGHERVRTELNEDMHMARFAKESGLRLRVVQNRDLYLTRMYTNFRDTWRGWCRIFYGCFGTFPRLLLSFMVLLVFSVSPWISAAAGWTGVGLGGWDQSAKWGWIAVAATIALGIQQSLLIRYYRVSQARWWYAPTYGIGSLLVLGMLGHAMIKLVSRGTTTWRGTIYRGGQVT